MLRTIMTAALILSLSLTVAGCGANNNASTAANRWNDGANNAQTQRNTARGSTDNRTTDGSYYADRTGRVDGYNTDSADGRRTNLGDGLTNPDNSMTNAGNGITNAGNGLANAGQDLARGAGNAARGVGDAVEDTLDGLTGTPKNSSR